MDAFSLGQLPKTPALQRTTSTDSLPKLSQLGKTPPKPNPLAFQRSNSSSSLQSPPSLDISGFQSQLEQSSPAQLLQEKPPVKPTRLQQALTQGFAPVEVHNHFSGIATTQQLLDQMQGVRSELVQRGFSPQEVAQEQFTELLKGSDARRAQVTDLDGTKKTYGQSQHFQRLEQHSKQNAITAQEATDLLEMGSNLGLGFGTVYYFRTDWSNGIRLQNLSIEKPLAESHELERSKQVKATATQALGQAKTEKTAAEKAYKSNPSEENRLALEKTVETFDSALLTYKNADTTYKRLNTEHQLAVKDVQNRHKLALKQLNSDDAKQRIAAQVTRDEVGMAIQSLKGQGIEYAEVQISASQAKDSVFMQAVQSESQRFGVDTRLLIGQSSNRLLSTIDKGKDVGEALLLTHEQLQEFKTTIAHPLIMGFDFNGPEKPFSHAGMENFKRCYVAMQEVANEQGRPLVLRPHIGEGDSHRADFAVEAENNIEMLLNKLQEMKNEGIYDPNGPVKVRLGHATHANPEQISRMKELGITAIETNISSNQETGSIREMLQHPLISQLIYEVPTILNTDGGGVMRTNLQTEYSKAQSLIKDFLEDQLPVTVPHDTKTQDLPAQMHFSDDLILKIVPLRTLVLT
jgi:adenosine deaminase